MSEATPYAPVSLDAVGEYTGPYALGSVSESVVFTIDVVSGSPTFVLEVSNDERLTRRYITVRTGTSSVAWRLRAAMPRFARVRMTGGSGQIDVALGKALSAGGLLTEVNFESRI